MTSILRTYYTWKIVQSPDASYDIVIMGLWTWAEITTSTIVSCFPIMPRFFHHMRLKVYGAFSHLSQPNRHFEANSQDKGNARNAALAVRPHGDSSITWNKALQQKPPYRGEYITLGEIDVSDVNEGISNDQLHATEGSHATKREDLEALSFSAAK